MKPIYFNKGRSASQPSLVGIVLVLVMVLGLSSTHIRAESGRDRPNFEIEIFGGLSSLDPVDLNYRAIYDQGYEDFYGFEQHNYYHSLYPDFYTFTGQTTGTFNKIRHALPAGFRLRTRINRSLSISVGLKFLRRNENSHVDSRYDFQSINPDGVQFINDYSNVRQSDPYSLSVEAYIPELGVFYQIELGKRLGFEGFLCAGPMMVECGIDWDRVVRQSDGYGYWYETRRSYEIRGKGTGFSAEAGIRLNVGLTRNIDLFLEGGYAFRQARKVSGSGSSLIQVQDANADAYYRQETWEGTWMNRVGIWEETWGHRYFQYPTNAVEPDTLTQFKLDLSGFQIRVGISIAFRL